MANCELEYVLLKVVKNNFDKFFPFDDVSKLSEN